MAFDSNRVDKRSFDDEFLRLLLKNHYKIYAYILSLTQNTSDADDIMQDVSTILWKKFDKFEPGSNFTAWAVQTARYKIYQYFQRKQKEHLLFSDRLLKDLEKSMTTKLEDADRRIEALKICLKKLSEREKKFIHLRYEKGMAAKNISMMMNSSVDAIYKVFSRAYNSLQLCIHKLLAQGGIGS